MSLWSRASSSRWASDVATASLRNTASHLPVPVSHQTPNNRRFQSGPSSLLRTLWKGMRHPTARASPLEHLPHPLHDLHTVDIDAEPKNDEPQMIDEVVVDRCTDWTKDYASSSHASVADESVVDDFEERYYPAAAQAHVGFWTSPIKHVWVNVKTFFNSAFPDPELEAEYEREVWYETKRLAELASVFLIVNWLMAVLSIPRPTVLADKIFYFGIAPVLALPIFVFCRYDFFIRYSTFYQTMVCVSAWSWAFYQILYVYMCGYYQSNTRIFTCGTKDFLSTFYYASAMQVVALFGLNLRRIPGLIGASTFLVFSSVLIIPHRSSWYRNIINFLAFQGFLLYMHFQRDVSARRLHLARIRLKLQIEKTIRAQVNERKAYDSKYRLISYVFHDESFFKYDILVRVPLNTALLAVQNMDASGLVPRTMLLEFNALEGSLSQMSKVLNDVLDFNRMDSGKFEVLMRPYPFHQVLRSMFLTLKLATSARELEFETDLDSRIDDFARRAQYKALGESVETIEMLMKEATPPEAACGIVAGDENRLRQIITNLAGNACKFTPKGGKLKISTRLIFPDGDYSEDGTKAGSFGMNTPEENPVHVMSLSANDLKEHNRVLAAQYAPEDDEKIVVRIEVTDTGLGISPQDMADANIFSAFIQTEQGRTQGGKGTGLGLALVRRIVKLSGGRLGIRSKVGVGSTFWVELPLGVGSKVLQSTYNDQCEPPIPPAFQNMFPLSTTRTMDSINSLRFDVSADHSDIVALRATQASPNSLRSSSALHSLMNQGGSVELSLAKYDSPSSVPTRTLGDPSSGTDFPRPGEDNLTVTHSPHGRSDTIDTMQTITLTSQARPTFIPLPSPRSFALDDSRLLTTNILTVSPDGISASSPTNTALFSGTPLSAAMPTSPSTGSALFNQCEVLVVDDDIITRQLMTRMLNRLGCGVTTAANGEIAMHMLMGTDGSKTRTPDSESSGPILANLPVADTQRYFSVIFLDNQMPVMSGLKVVAELRQAGRKDFVVGVTGNALITDQKEYLDAGADYVLIKPVYERSLTNMLYEAEQRRKVGLRPSGS